MFTRTIALAAALTTAGAMSAYAQGTVGADITNNNQVLEENAEAPAEGTTTVDKDVYENNGKDMVVISNKEVGSAKNEAVDKMDDPEDRGDASNTTPDEILAIAQPGQMVRTVTGDPVGTVSYIEEQGEAGNLVFVDLDPAAGLQVPTVGIQVKSLQSIEEGSVLEYAFSIDYLRDRIQEAM